MRLFVAVWPPPDVVQQLERLPRPDHPAVRWTTPDQWHVTLRFLGDVPDAEVTGLTAALEEVARGLGERDAVLGPTTKRLGRGSLVAPVQGIDDLGTAVIEAMAELGKPAPERPFTGHLTLARGRGKRPVPPSLAGPELAARWRVRSLAIVRSELYPDGARYHDLVRLPLAS